MLGVQLLRLQPLPDHLYQYRGLGGVGVQLLRLQPFPGHLYQDRGLGGVVVQLLWLQPLPGHLYQDRGLGSVGVQLLRLQPLSGHLYLDRGLGSVGGTASHAPAPPWQPVPGQRVRKCLWYSFSGFSPSLNTCTSTEGQEVLG